ncbi:unnamed protein product [Clavelina lepadiformis]|uniref:Uncharacterized protein n=1 Tax=Clavelina lepadiformis TaxID=159417 RepID=A0ABP0FJ41_CLALP
MSDPRNDPWSETKVIAVEKKRKNRSGESDEQPEEPEAQGFMDGQIPYDASDLPPNLTRMIPCSCGQHNRIRRNKSSSRTIPNFKEPNYLSSASACLVQSAGPLTARHFFAGDCSGQRFAFRVFPPRYYFPYLPLSSVPSSTAKLAKVSTEDDFKTKAS